MIFDELTEKIIAMQNPTAVGLDTLLEYLPEELTESVKDERGAAAAILEFNRNVIDAVSDIVPAVKVQIAYYESYGASGMQAFYDTLRYAKSKGLIVIADAKRNDIGATAARYAAAFLGRTQIGKAETEAFPCDILTVNGYLGSDGIAPFVKECQERGKGIFVLVKTSNPSSGELQNLKLSDGRTVYECMGDMVERWGEGTAGSYGFQAVGAVVGATYPEEAEILRKRLPRTFFLVPGYGAQGGSAQSLKPCFERGGLGAIVNNSRGILCAYRKTGGSYFEAARTACLNMKADLLSVLGEICAN